MIFFLFHVGCYILVQDELRNDTISEQQNSQKLVEMLSADGKEILGKQSNGHFDKE